MMGCVVDRSRGHFRLLAHNGAFVALSCHDTLDIINLRTIECLSRYTPAQTDVCIRRKGRLNLQTHTPASLNVGSTRFCWICGRAVSLESCKADEHGNMVHEDCYLVRMKLNNSAPGVRANDPPKFHP